MRRKGGLPPGIAHRQALGPQARWEHWGRRRPACSCYPTPIDALSLAFLDARVEKARRRRAREVAGGGAVFSGETPGNRLEKLFPLWRSGREKKLGLLKDLKSQFVTSSLGNQYRLLREFRF